jgi:TRAP-type C4-dicarboxylate transport system permease large subunit
MNTGGITRRLFRFATSLIGHIPGGLGHANVIASIIFAGMSGAAIADAGGLGTIEIKAMKDEGFDTVFSAAITAASSTIGPIIPPRLGIDPVHFGLVMVLNLMIGLITPPVGVVLYIVSDVAKIPFEATVRATTPLLVPLLIVLLLVTFIPQIPMFLPNLLLR